MSSLSFEAMGCRFELLIDPRGSCLNRLDCQSIAEEMQNLVVDWHNRLSIFDPQSVISRFNRSPSGTEFMLDQDMYSLCVLCDQLRVQTNGAFNISAGTLMHAHGFRDSPAHGISIGNLNLNDSVILNPDRQSITKNDDRVQLDFGAIGKGYVLDLIREELIQHGVKNAFIHGGTSSAIAIGQDSHERIWTASVGQEFKVRLSGYSVGVSESLSRIATDGDQVIGHVMDPRSNLPVESVSQVVCVHRSAAVADAYSTACSVSPTLAGQLSADPCTLILTDSVSSPTLHDPLGVVSLRIKSTI